MNQTVSTHTTAIEAQIVRGRLEFEGIPAFIVFGNHVWADWSLSVALGGVRVQVPFSCVQEAMEVIENITSGKYKQELEEEILCSKPTGCPKCDSLLLIPVNWPWKFSLVMIFLFFVPIPYTRHLMKCGKCAHQWLATEQRGYPLYVLSFAILFLSALFFIAYAAWCYLCKLYCEQPLCM